MKYAIALIIALSAVFCSVSAAVADGLPAAPAGSAAPPSEVGAMAPNSAVAVSAVAPNYVIGPGDMLQVFVWRNPELSTTVPVRPDGKVSTPLVEDMVAVGKTPSELARDLEKVLGTYVRSPQVNVIVVQPISTLSQVKVVGQVAKPQAVPFREGMTVLDVILQVGGLTQFAAGNRARIVRHENGKDRLIPVRLEALLNKGDMRENVVLKSNDVVVVPESIF